MSKPVTLKSNRDDSDRFDDVKIICSFLANSQVHNITLYTLKGFYILNVINNCLNLHRFLHRFFLSVLALYDPHPRSYVVT